MNYLDNITLEYFTNRNQYETIFKKTDPTIQKKFSSDKRFYKKRVIDLTKRLFKNEIQDIQLVNVFNGYIKSCINYLEFLDKSDVMQDKYDKTDNIIDSNNNEKLSIVGDIIIDDSENIKNNIDDLLFKKEDVKKVNLDNFVIKKNTVEKPKILPKKEIINVREKKYKTKGVKESKEEKKNKK